MTIASIADQMIKYLWEEPDEEAMLALFSDRYAVPNLSSVAVTSPQDLITFCAITRAQISDIVVGRVVTTHDASWVSSCITLNGLVRSSKAPFSIFGTTHLKLENGKIVEMWNCFNMLTYFIELGRLPRNFMEDLLVATDDESEPATDTVGRLDA